MMLFCVFQQPKSRNFYRTSTYQITNGGLKAPTGIFLLMTGHQHLKSGEELGPLFALNIANIIHCQNV